MSTGGSGASRAGIQEGHNEDVFLVEDGLGLYVVCDGASRSPAGEIAARVATEAVAEFIERADVEFEPYSSNVARQIVEHAMHYALNAVRAEARAEPRHRGLATTITVLLAHGRVGVIGHCGDSRAYLIRRRRAAQLTRDHDLTHAASDALRSVDFDIFSIDLEAGDTIVLCTDGAEEILQDSTFVQAAGDLSPQLLASRIVSAAHKRTPSQDATAVAVRVRKEHDPGWIELSSPSRGTTFGHTIELA